MNTKNTTLYIIVCLLFTTVELSGSDKAENPYFGPKTNYLSIGTGFGLYAGGYGYGFSMPIMATLDHKIDDQFSAGIYGAYWAASWDYSYWGDYRFRSTHLGVRASFHFIDILTDLFERDLDKEKYDLFITPWLGYNARSAKWTSIDGTQIPNTVNFRNRFQGGISIGGRYQVKSKFGVFFESGITPSAYSNFGLFFKV